MANTTTTETVSLLDIVNEVENYSSRKNILSAFRLLEIGKYLELKAGQVVIDCGCGRGEALRLWAKSFGVIGVGIDSHAPSIADATALAEREGAGDKVRFVHADTRTYDLQGTRYDVAACLGATMGFGGFQPAIRRMKAMIVPGGQIVIGEAFFTTHDVPEELKEYEGDEPTETELFEMARAAGCEVGYYSRASRAEWEWYVFNGNRCVKDYLEAPAGRAREKISPRRWQDMYLHYRQRWQGMAFMTVHPA